MLNASPASNLVTEQTPLSSGLMARDTIVCKFITIDDAVTIGSTVRCGIAACPPTPDTTISNLSHAARIGPGLDAITPVGILHYALFLIGTRLAAKGRMKSK